MQDLKRKTFRSTHNNQYIRVSELASCHCECMSVRREKSTEN